MGAIILLWNFMSRNFPLSDNYININTISINTSTAATLTTPDTAHGIYMVEFKT